MPRLSFALVAHREQGYLEPLVASILEQAPADIEIVAIDDASPDHVPVLLDELAERDQRLRVRHLPSRVGLGEGRNLALEMAEGEYAWFVRTTGLLPPGALKAVLDRVDETQPDVLLVQHTRAATTGGGKPGPHGELLGRVAASGVVTLDACPELARLAPGGQNKLFRRQFLTDLGIRFGSGGHSEVCVTWPALLAAARIAAEPSVACIGRTPPNAVRDEHVEGSPLDVFDRYEAVFAFIEAHPELPGDRRELVAPAMLRHELALMGRVPASERRAFFEQVTDGWRRHGTGAAMRWRTFRLREQGRSARRAFRRLPRAVASRLRRRLRPAKEDELQRYYRARLREPIDPHLAVFAAYWYRGYACNPRAIYERARELLPDLRGVWVVNADAADTMPADVEYVIAGSREYYDLIARAAYCVNNVNFPNHLVKREGTTHLMTHHGTPVKRMGFDLVDTPGADSRVGFAGLLRRCSRWDFSVTQNAFTTVAWERAFPTRHETLEVGYPRNDALATATDEDVRRIRAELGIDPEQQVVLYAPTHREYLPDYTPMLDLAALADGLGPGYVVMARLHYLYREDPHLRDLHAAGRIRDVAAHPSVEDLCLAADALITDYSSIMFDYGVLDRPIVIHAPDWDEYTSRRGTYFDLVAQAPGVVTATDAELIEAFRSGAVFDEEARQRRAAFRARFCYLDDGHAAERVIRRVWLGEREPAPAPPAAVLR